MVLTGEMESGTGEEAREGDNAGWTGKVGTSGWSIWMDWDCPFRDFCRNFAKLFKFC